MTMSMIGENGVLLERYIDRDNYYVNIGFTTNLIVVNSIFTCIFVFAATAREECRGDLPDIGSAESSSADVPSDADLKMCMSALADAKMHGLDDIFIEAYTASPTAKKCMFDLVKRCWVE